MSVNSKNVTHSWNENKVFVNFYYFIIIISF